MKTKMMVGLILSTLVVTMVATVFANEISTTDTSKKQTQSITVDYTIGEKYTVIIPADLTLSEESNAVAQKIEAKDVRLATGKVLSVKMTSTNGYKVNYDNSYINYMVKQGDTETTVETKVTENDVALFSVESGMTEKKTYLKFYTTSDEIGKATQSGKHEDTLTFSCEVK